VTSLYRSPSPRAVAAGSTRSRLAPTGLDSAVKSSNDSSEDHHTVDDVHARALALTLESLEHANRDTNRCVILL
jgi:hypothetical protein